jgi:hypothetical protein
MQSAKAPSLAVVAAAPGYGTPSEPMALTEAFPIAEQVRMSTSWDANDPPTLHVVLVGAIARPGQTVSFVT